MLDAGKLRHRLVIQSLSWTQDPLTGEAIEAWATLATVWGAFEPFSTKDRLAAASVSSSVSARAVIRYRGDVLPEMRVSFRNKIYEIDGPPLPDPDSGLEYLTLMLKEVDDG